MEFGLHVNQSVEVITLSRKCWLHIFFISVNKLKVAEADTPFNLSSRKIERSLKALYNIIPLLPYTA